MIIIDGDGPSNPATGQPISPLYLSVIWTHFSILYGVLVWLIICNRLTSCYYKSTRARVAKLVDALDLGSSVFDVGVQVPPRAPLIMPFGSIMNGESLV